MACRTQSAPGESGGGPAARRDPSVVCSSSSSNSGLCLWSQGKCKATLQRERFGGCVVRMLVGRDLRPLRGPMGGTRYRKWLDPFPDRRGVGPRYRASRGPRQQHRLLALSARLSTRSASGHGERALLSEASRSFGLWLWLLQVSCVQASDWRVVQVVPTVNFSCSYKKL